MMVRSTPENIHWRDTDLEETDQDDRADLYLAMLQAQSDLGEGFFVVEDAHIAFANDAFFRICGYRPGELRNLEDFLDIVIPAHRQRFLDQCQATLAREMTPERSELSIHHRAGHRVDLEVAVRFYGVGAGRGTMIMIRDVTERKLAESALRESEKRFRAMADSASVLIWVAGPDGHVIYVNNPYLEFTGRTQQEEKGEGWLETVHPEDLPALRAVLATAREEQKEFHREYRVRRVDGVYRWLLASGAPHYREEGVFAGLIGSCVDITERKLSELAREEALQENARLLQEVQGAAHRHRIFIQEMVEIVTDGRLRLCDSTDDLPATLPDRETPEGTGLVLDRNKLRALRVRLERLTQEMDFPDERASDLITGAGEATMNAVMHGGDTRTAETHVFVDRAAKRIQVWIKDQGTGIDMKLLHRATLQPGFSSSGSLGYGFWIMIQTCDSVYLLTTPEGTTVVLEQELVSPGPARLAKNLTENPEDGSPKTGL